jgi:glutathione synthase/RimK-type ligase-like ATP-grasp enzyme
MSEFLGIARERVYSPGKVNDDRAILDAVACRLSERHRVRVISPDDDWPEPPADAAVFAMCQGPAALSTLRRWESRGVRVINSSTAIEGCHRHRMIRAFEQAQVAQPDTIMVPTDDDTRLPEWLGGRVAQEKTFATQAGHVAESTNRRATRWARKRGIRRVVVQRHIEGAVVKFYAVRSRFFAWFSGEGFEPSPAQLERMRRLAEDGAACLGLDVFGGDCVEDRNGRLHLIDLNDWPSYGRCRSTAANLSRNISKWATFPMKPERFLLVAASPDQRNSG